MIIEDEKIRGLPPKLPTGGMAGVNGDSRLGRFEDNRQLDNDRPGNHNDRQENGNDRIEPARSKLIGSSVDKDKAMNQLANGLTAASFPVSDNPVGPPADSLPASGHSDTSLRKSGPPGDSLPGSDSLDEISAFGKMPQNEEHNPDLEDVSLLDRQSSHHSEQSSKISVGSSRPPPRPVSGTQTILFIN